MKRTLIALLLAGCSWSTSSPKTSPLVVEVESQSWYATAVYLYCVNGRPLGRIYDLQNQPRQRHVFHLPPSCLQIGGFVRYLSQSPELIDPPIPVEELDTVVIRIPPSRADSVVSVLAPRARDRDRVREVADLIMRASAEARMDPILVANVIRVENPWLLSDTTSHAGAIGLMQIMPFHRGSYGCIGPLTNDSINLCLGTSLLRDYLHRSLRAALLRYNGCTRSECRWYAWEVQESL